jgi:hypothetical protein
LECTADRRSPKFGRRKRDLDVAFKCRMGRPIAGSAEKGIERLVKRNFHALWTDHDTRGLDYRVALFTLAGSVQSPSKCDARGLARREALAQDRHAVAELHVARRDFQHSKELQWGRATTRAGDADTNKHDDCGCSRGERAKPMHRVASI